MRRNGVGAGVITLALGLVGAPAAAAAGYQPAAVSDGGTIAGTVTYGGTPPPAKTVKTTKDQQQCGAVVPDEALMVGANKGIENVVVRLTDIKKGKKWEAKPVIDQKKCHFQPHVVVAEAGKDVEILNSDGILHNIHTYSTANPPINIPQPKFKPKMMAKFARPEATPIKINCDVHPWMQGWLVVTVQAKGEAKLDAELAAK